MLFHMENIKNKDAPNKLIYKKKKNVKMILYYIILYYYKIKTELY